MSRRSEAAPRSLFRLAALALLALSAFFALTASLDPCGEECADAACHLLCLNGCTTTPVPPIPLASSPLEAGERTRLARPLPPADPALGSPELPPRAAA